MPRRPPCAGVGSNGSSPGGVLRTVSDALAGEDEVDLLVEDAILLRHGDRHEEHAEDVVAVRLERRAAARCSTSQRLQTSSARQLHAGMRVSECSSRGRIEQVDPASRRRPSSRG